MFISAELATHTGTVRVTSLDKTPLHRGSGAAFEVFVNGEQKLSFTIPDGHGLFNAEHVSVTDHILGREDFSRDKFVSAIQAGVIESFNQSPASSRTPEAREGIKSSIIKLRMSVERGMTAEDLLKTARTDAQSLFPMDENAEQRISDAREFAVVRLSETNLKLAVIQSVRTALLAAVQSYEAPRVTVPDIDLNDLSVQPEAPVEKPVSQPAAPAVSVEPARSIQNSADVQEEVVEEVVTAEAHEDDAVYDDIDDRVADILWDEGDAEVFTPENDELIPDGFGDPTLDETRPDTGLPEPDREQTRFATGRDMHARLARSGAPLDVTSRRLTEATTPRVEDEEFPDFGAQRQRSLFPDETPDIPDSLDFDDPDFSR